MTPIWVSTMNLLELSEGVSGYGEVIALRSASISVGRGEVVAILGANGAGKSTLLKTIVGLLPLRVGSLNFDGRPIDRLETFERMALGIVLCPEGRRLFPQMTVFENIRMGAYLQQDRGVFKRRLAALREMFPKLAEREQQVASSLSGGEQQMVAIARALMSQPKLLMLDEPTLGLAPLMIHEVARLIQLIRAEGISVILVEQNAKLALKLADRAYVIEQGSVTLEGRCDDLLGSEHIQKIYLGG